MEDKSLRRTRDRFDSPKTQAAMHDAILAVPAITVFDVERIIAQLRKRLGEFKHLPHFKDFRGAAIAWVTRQAQLTTQLRAYLRETATLRYISTLLYLKLPDYQGSEDAAEFHAWIMETAAREREAIEALAYWIRFHRNTVYVALRRVLVTCRDLDKNLEDVADGLSSEVWAYVADHAAEFLNSPDPIHQQLKRKAYWLARAWKSKRLDGIAKGDIGRPISSSPEEVEAAKAYYEGSGKLPPRPIVLGDGDDGADETAHLDQAIVNAAKASSVDAGLPMAA